MSDQALQGLTIYDASTDEVVSLTQESLDRVTRAINRFARRHAVLRKVLNWNLVHDWEKIEKVCKLVESL